MEKIDLSSIIRENAPIPIIDIYDGEINDPVEDLDLLSYKLSDESQVNDKISIGSIINNIPSKYIEEVILENEEGEKHIFINKRIHGKTEIKSERPMLVGSEYEDRTSRMDIITSIYKSDQKVHIYSRDILSNWEYKGLFDCESFRYDRRGNSVILPLLSVFLKMNTAILVIY